MVKNLKTLLIIVSMSLFSCSSGDNYDSNTNISKYNNKILMFLKMKISENIH